ncbi:MAG: hypothetical protein ACI9R3_002950, partial [Verrucomicrobiales bacterium]
RMKKLIVVADTGKLRAFRLTPSEMIGSRDRIEELETDLEFPKPAPTDVADDDGNFPSGAATNGSLMQHGESHGRVQEEERRAIKEIVRVITELVNAEDYEIWNFAAPQSVCKRFVQQFPMLLQERLTRVKEHDYTGLPIKEIENVFR